jgi:hypothetical protein
MVGRLPGGAGGRLLSAGGPRAVFSRCRLSACVRSSYCCLAELLPQLPGSIPFRQYQKVP